MFGLTRAATGLGRRDALRVPVVTLATPRSRNTSWIAWEQPNPAIYVNCPASTHASSESQRQQQQQTGSIGSQTSASGTRPAGETAVAPATASMPVGNQEVSTSGKTMPPSIQAGPTRSPFSGTSSSQQQQQQQTRSLNTQRDTGYLPTTHLCIPGHAATWPCEAPEEPHQQRVRKLSRSAHHTNSDEQPEKKHHDSSRAAPKETNSGTATVTNHTAQRTYAASFLRGCVDGLASSLERGAIADAETKKMRWEAFKARQFRGREGAGAGKGKGMSMSMSSWHD